MCSRTTDTAASGGGQAQTTGRSYTITGMTCQPCATKVTRAVEQTPAPEPAAVDA